MNDYKARFRAQLEADKKKRDYKADFRRLLKIYQEALYWNLTVNDTSKDKVIKYLEVCERNYKAFKERKLKFEGIIWRIRLYVLKNYLKNGK